MGLVFWLPESLLKRLTNVMKRLLDSHAIPEAKA